MAKESNKNQAVDEVKPYKPKKGEAYMSDPMRQHFDTLLVNQRAVLVNKIDDTVTHLKDETDHISDLNDRATQEEEFSLELRTRDREGKLVEKIDEALRLLEDDDYGYCEECGVEIGIKRLEARPTATLCIDCKTLAEIKEKQDGL
jgi:DnaK suppressor protein